MDVVNLSSPQQGAGDPGACHSRPMLPRERVLAAIEHKPMDRIPVNYLGSPEADLKLRRHFHLSEQVESHPGDAQDYDWDILDCLGADLRALRLPYTGPELPVYPDNRKQDVFGVVYRPVRNEVGSFSETCVWPYADFKTVADVERYRWPSPDWYDYSALPSQCDRWHDYAIVYGWPGNLDLINGTAFGRGVERTLMDIATEDPVGLAVMQRRFEFSYEHTRRSLEACRGRIDIVWIGDDYGTQRGLLMSSQKWRRLFRAPLQAMADLSHQHGARLMLHSCGSTRQLWPDLVEIGVDIYDTVQPEARGMIPSELAAEFGQRICLHGTVSTQKTLPFGTPADVAREVSERICQFREGGLILAPSHNIQPDTPVENILAIYQAAGSLARAEVKV